jgi:DNA-binding NtrC family response regulator
MAPFGSGLILEAHPVMPPALATLRVLVIDDEPLIRWSMSETLRTSGHTVTEALDGDGARRVLAEGPPPDVVLLDYRLPNSHGLMLLADVRRLAPSAAVVMMTAYGEDDLVEDAIALGATRVIEKPVDMRELDAVVRAAAASH